MKTQEKYYLADVSLKYALFGYNRNMLDAVMENIVYLELKRRGYDVYVGKLGSKEIDFVCILRDEKSMYKSVFNYLKIQIVKLRIEGYPR